MTLIINKYLKIKKAFIKESRGSIIPLGSKKSLSSTLLKNKSFSSERKVLIIVEKDI